MRYTLENNTLKPITFIRLEDKCISNPTDEFIDENKLGYPYTKVDPPVNEDITKKVTHTYVIKNNVIKDKWTVEAKTNQELVATYKQEIAKLDFESTNYKNAGEVEYTNGKKYTPRWVFEFYNTMILLKDAEGMFPAKVACTDGSTDSFTFDEFMQLYGFIVTTFATYTAENNAKIAEYNTKIKELEN